MAPNKTVSRAGEILTEIDALLAEINSEELTAHARKQLLQRVDDMRGRLEELTRKVDPNELPDAFFDPAEPTLIGNFVALAMVAQDRKPLKDLSRFYGSGVYAIYYTGDNSLYAPISGTETPIYVGKADPQGNPKTAVDQGTRLADRLNEHKRNIDKVSGIELSDFEYRALAVQTGYQAAAESHLIRMFQPIWNNETRILYGLGKHGDAATTRANNRSPFDTVHPGRKWAEDNRAAKTAEEISEEVAEHFKDAMIYADINSVLRAFVSNIKREDRLSKDDDVARSNLSDAKGTNSDEA